MIFVLSIVVHPESGLELESRQYESYFARLINGLKNDLEIEFIDLLDYYRTNKIMIKEPYKYFGALNVITKPGLCSHGENNRKKYY